MIPFWNRRGSGARPGSRRLRVEFTVLEDRRLPTIGTLNVTVVPHVIYPATGRVVEVTVSGTFRQIVLTNLGNLTSPPPQPQLDQIDAANAAKPGPSSVVARVTDEYRRLEPRVSITPHLDDTRTFFYAKSKTVATALEGLIRDYSFQFPFFLEAKKSDRTPDGRHYDISVTAQDADGINGTNLAVLVPKDSIARQVIDYVNHPPQPQKAGSKRHG